MALSRRNCILALAALGGAATLGLASAGGGAANGRPPRGLRLARQTLQAPDLAVYGSDGAALALRDLAGKPALLLFWATWCSVCRGEMPKIERLSAAVGDEAHIVPISLDRDGLPVVERYLSERGLDGLPAYLDRSGVIADRLGVRQVPMALVLDRSGRIVAYGAGRIAWDSAAAPAFLTAL